MGNRTKSTQGNSSVMIFVILAVLLIGGGSFYAIFGGKGSSGSGGNPGSGVAATGGQSLKSMEDQVKTLTEQGKANPLNAKVQEDLGTALFNLASAYMQANDQRALETLNKTIQVYNNTLKLEPESKETLGDLATAYFYSNQVDLAISTVEKALKLDPTFVPALFNYGIYLADGKGEFQKAIEQMEKVPSGTPQYSQAQSMIKEYKQALSAPKTN